MGSFQFRAPPQIIVEDGACERLGERLATRGLRHALVVTDPFLAGCGLIDAAVAGLAGQGVAATVFDGVEPDPPEASVQAGVDVAGRAGVDVVIGFGGGSAMDTAKLVALLGASGETLAEVYGVDQSRGPRLPLVQIPTTAGTGSEATPISIITTPDGQKTGVVSDWLYPDLAILDATLTLGLPPRATAMTGVDAMVHAVEAYTSRLKKNAISDALAVRALGLLSANIRRVVEEGSDLVARRAMLEGSLLAGMAFANAPVAAVHALAYPLGGLFHVPHGLSNALVFAEVADFNLAEASQSYADLAVSLPDDLTERCHNGDGFVTAIRRLVSGLPMEQRLGDVGVRPEDLDRLSDDAMKITRLLVNNPRDMTRADARAIYAAVL
ncbi:iron-containing alcohol dehydrogenase [Brevundimonas aveniformis]|uniref:iron-containing alcohol dehydrogenase n=1 Tax=Brevundimonas aveniformis TaxID=370977 RepID=UPI0004081A46|nr:iron-containing alcohol dehydrogenase [Brevundimonas aveniformis]